MPSPLLVDFIVILPTVRCIRFSLRQANLESDYNQSDENVNEETWKDDDVSDKEQRHTRTVIHLGTCMNQVTFVVDRSMIDEFRMLKRR